MTSFEKFGENFQAKILYHLITDSDFSLQVLDILKPEFFSQENYRIISQLIHRWNEKYGTIPSFENLKTLLVKLYKEDEILAEYMESLVSDIENKTSVLDKSHVIDETVEFCKQQAFRNAIFQSVELVKKEQYDQIYTIFQKAMIAGEKKNIGHDYFADMNQRVMERRYPISTGFQMIDSRIAGGLSGGDLGIILAGTGIGKSMVLTHLAAEAYKQGKNVLYYTFELAEKLVGLRLDAKIAGIPLTSLLTDIDGGLRTRIRNAVELERKKHKVPPELRIKFYPTGTATIQTLYNHLRLLENQGFKPDIIFIDYTDIMRATNHYAEKRYELQGLTEELRGMAGTLNIPIWTASQTNRDGWDSSIVGLKTISESSAKAFVADLVISIGRSQRLVDEGRACYYIAKSRLGPDKLPFTGEFDTSLLRFTVDSEGFDEDELREQDRRSNMNRAVDRVRNSETAQTSNNNLNEILRTLDIANNGDDE